MTTKTNGPAAWNLNRPEEKTNLTAEAINAKSRQIAADYQDLFVAFALAVGRMAAAGDALGLQCFSTATKTLLTGAAEMCMAAVDAEDILE